ncbi:hypothetical protein SOVF_011130 [Spinacia oleracea]|uniref:UPF0481 protein At3g47200 n=1 Tax=Spinacia oleracea TaxID=3562 RepID=A0A9R0HYU9_SPIOL|nr:UPF0481 protein At3g47200-like [Spinacia oleracea]KNA24929.1 hypothetical protein SOVF_011130 [Spinacia oleracea]
MTDKITTDVEVSIRRQLESLVQSGSSNQCIYRVPEHLRKVKLECYEPLVVSIGPLYHDNPTLLSSHDLKLRHLQCFLNFDVSTNGINAKSLGQYIDIIRGLEKLARSYYAEKITLCSDEFVEMVLIDAAFIIFLFMEFSNHFILRSHPMENKYDVMLQVHQDLFLEENQLPFFVISRLFDEALGEAYPNITFKDVTCDFIGNSFFPGREVAQTTGKDRLTKVSNIKHLVHVLRICCLPTKLRYELPENKNSLDSDEFPLTAKELKALGVKFMASESKVLLDITFSEGVLYIPTLTIQDLTESNLRSIVFFEQCHHFYDSYVIDYLFFLDALIHTSEDVQILAQHGIIKHWLGSNDDVATLFNRITKNLTMKNPGFYYAQVCQDLKVYPTTMSMSRKNKWKAVFKRDYFDYYPWSITVLIILVALQVYSGFMK